MSRGWSQIEAVYQKLFSGSNRVRVEFWDYSIVETTDCFVAIGRERGTLTGSDGAELALRIRTTRVFRRTAESGWRQVHHHGSIDEPRLLADYQTVVRGTSAP